MTQIIPKKLMAEFEREQAKRTPEQVAQDRKEMDDFAKKHGMISVGG